MFDSVIRSNIFVFDYKLLLLLLLFAKTPIYPGLTSLEQFGRGIWEAGAIILKKINGMKYNSQILGCPFVHLARINSFFFSKLCCSVKQF